MIVTCEFKISYMIYHIPHISQHDQLIKPINPMNPIHQTNQSRQSNQSNQSIQSIYSNQSNQSIQPIQSIHSIKAIKPINPINPTNQISPTNPLNPTKCGPMWGPRARGGSGSGPIAVQARPQKNTYPGKKDMFYILKCAVWYVLDTFDRTLTITKIITKPNDSQLCVKCAQPLREQPTVVIFTHLVRASHQPDHHVLCLVRASA